MIMMSVQTKHKSTELWLWGILYVSNLQYILLIQVIWDAFGSSHTGRHSFSHDEHLPTLYMCFTSRMKNVHDFVICVISRNISTFNLPLLHLHSSAKEHSLALVYQYGWNGKQNSLRRKTHVPKNVHWVKMLLQLSQFSAMASHISISQRSALLEMCVLPLCVVISMPRKQANKTHKHTLPPPNM